MIVNPIYLNKMKRKAKLFSRWINRLSFMETQIKQMGELLAVLFHSIPRGKHFTKTNMNSLS